MQNNGYLNEERYQKNEKIVGFLAIIILVIGLFIGGYLIYNGVAKPKSAKVDELKIKLEEKKNYLESNGIKSSKNYSDGEAYDLYIITKALDPSFPWCESEECKNNSLTKEYCSAKNSTGDFASTSYIMFGTFICIATCMISFSIFMFAKRRAILAFQTQQVMPIAQEGIEKVAPSVGKAAGTIAKDISAGIEEGKNSDKK